MAILSGTRAGTFDLPALLAAHRAGGAAVTALALSGKPGPWAGAAVIDGAWAHTRLGNGPDGIAALLRTARREGFLREAPQDAPWRDTATLDAFRLAWTEIQGGVPFPLPLESGPPETPLGGPDLVIEAGGLALTVPRFGPRRGGRWTLLEDSAVMPGARVAPGARLVRAVITPGAVVPAGLVVGEDPEEDARWFRVTPEGTTLVTARMLARRAAERMRSRLAAALPRCDPAAAAEASDTLRPALRGAAGLTRLETD